MATYYVKPGDPGTNSGTQANPWLSLQSFMDLPPGNSDICMCQGTQTMAAGLQTKSGYVWTTIVQVIGCNSSWVMDGTFFTVDFNNAVYQGLFAHAATDYCWKFRYIRFYNSKTGSGTGSIVPPVTWQFWDCLFDTMRACGTAMFFSGAETGMTLYRCRFLNCNVANSYAIYNTGGGQFIRCIFDNVVWATNVSSNNLFWKCVVRNSYAGAYCYYNCQVIECVFDNVTAAVYMVAGYRNNTVLRSRFLNCANGIMLAGGGQIVERENVFFNVANPRVLAAGGIITQLGSDGVGAAGATLAAAGTVSATDYRTAETDPARGYGGTYLDGINSEFGVAGLCGGGRVRTDILTAPIVGA
jgi:hypothetical protein